jgi:putrescine aminotransferase
VNDVIGTKLMAAKGGALAQPAVVDYAQHVNPAFVKVLGVLGYGRLFVKARDVWVWDHEGRRYLDFLAGYGAVNLGHNHPRLLERLRDFLGEESLNLCHIGPGPQAAALGRALAQRLGESLSVCLFSSSGGEAVDAAMKLARAATRRTDFVFCHGGFHGTSLGTLSVMGGDRLRKHFEPLLPGCVAIPFGDLVELRKALASRRFAAFIVEPIQAEGGVIVPPLGYFSEAQELCRRHGTLLVLDEVQTGLGRTGALFAHHGEGFVPDILVLAKSLSGSIAPIGATVTSPAIQARAYSGMERFDLHSSTFGGNAFSCVAALESLNIIDDEGLVANAAARGQGLLCGLQERLASHPLVHEVRGRGLLVGIEFGPTDRGLLNRSCPWVVEMIARKVFGQWVALQLLERNIICQPATLQPNVLRLEPPLTVQSEQVQEVVAAVGEVLDEYRSVAPVMKDVTIRLMRQFLNGGRF